MIYFHNFHSCTVHFDLIQSFISPTNAKYICFKTLKFTLKYITNAPFVIYFNVNCNVLKQNYRTLIGLIKDWT